LSPNFDIDMRFCWVYGISFNKNTAINSMIYINSSVSITKTINSQKNSSTKLFIWYKKSVIKRKNCLIKIIRK
jgi:hypothetical protein